MENLTYHRMRPEVGDLKEFFHITDDVSTQVCMRVCVRACVCVCVRVCVCTSLYKVVCGMHFHVVSLYDTHFTAQVWPADNALFKAAMQELYSSMHKVAFIILECMARALNLQVCLHTCSTKFCLWYIKFYFMSVMVCL